MNFWTVYHTGSANALSNFFGANRKKQGSWLTASSTGHELPQNCALWGFDIIMSDEWALRRVVCIVMFNCESKRPLKWIVMPLKPDIML